MKKHDALVNCAESLGYTASQIGRILGALNEEGGAVEQVHASAAGLTRLRSINAAAASDNVLAVQIEKVLAFAAHRGIKILVDKVIDVRDLDKQFRESHRDISIFDRLFIKSSLGAAGCL